MKEVGVSLFRHPHITSYLDKWAFDSPGKVAVVQAEEGRQWMYSQLAYKVDVLTQKLWKEGLSVGDRLVSFLPNNPENMALMWACWRLGVAYVPLTDSHLDQNLGDLMRSIQPKLCILTQRAATYMLSKGVKFRSSPFEWRVWNAQGKGMGKLGLKNFSLPNSRLTRIFGRRRKTWEEISGQLHGWQPALILHPYTAGNTEEPMIICYQQIQAQIQAVSELIRLGKNVKALSYPPVQYAESIILSMILPIVLGGTAVLTNATSTVELRTLVNKYHVNMLVPRSVSMEKHFTSGPNSAEWSSLSHILFPYPKSHEGLGSTLFCKKIGGIHMKECGGYMALQHPKFDELFIPLTAISIREEMKANGREGREVERGQIGEVCVHPPLVHGGFLSSEGIHSPNVSREGLFYTGMNGRLVEREDRIFLEIRLEEQQAVAVPMVPAA